MSFPVPVNLSPSRVEAFTSCPLAFRFASIEKLPEPPRPHTTKGSLVHRALELLFVDHRPHQRTLDAGMASLAKATAEYEDELHAIGMDPIDEAALRADTVRLMRRYFEMEDPSRITDIGVELYLEAKVGRLTLRGIIDRLELDDDGGLIVTDYKTGRPPMAEREQRRLGGVHFYAFLCQQVFGQRPAQIRLMYLSTGEVITVRPSEQSIQFLPRRTAAVWQAVERACEAGDFRPRTGPLCDYCAFKPWCPSFGGDPDRAKFEAPVAYAQGPVQLPFRTGVSTEAIPAAGLHAAVARFDEWFDHALDHVRGNPVADRVFYLASGVGDWSMIWHLVGAGRAAIDPTKLPSVARLSAILGAESVLVNQGVKRLFKRGRPAFEGTRPHRLRTPSTTSFPSGHASAAFCAAAILSGEDRSRAPLWYGLAAIVALSRPYVHIHHASDMVGGAVIGYVVGRAARALWST